MQFIHGEASATHAKMIEAAFWQGHCEVRDAQHRMVIEDS